VDLYHDRLMRGGAYSAPTSGAADKLATDRPFTTYDIQSCLYDERRVQHLRDAIFKTVREGDVVVDAGSGTGLLGLFAAQAGASKVYCLELNADFIAVIEQNAARNGLQDRIQAVNADATSCGLPEEVDVIISEVISAGFFYEPQIQIINNLRRFLKPGGTVVPMSMRNHVELISAQEELYGLQFSYDARFTSLEGDRSLTSPACYLSTEFGEHVEPTIRAGVTARATGTGRANAVRVTYEIQFADGLWVDKPTEFLLNPQIIFLPQPIEIESGRDYRVAVNYTASDNPLNCEITVTPTA
jgi:precorrin-6B methylase 2